MTPSPVPVTATESFASVFDTVAANIDRVIQGKSEAVRLALTCLIAEGHLLIEDVPGVGKTSLAKSLAISIECSWRRLQFTPDLLPSDVLGVTVYERDSGQFSFRPGPVFANVLLADEINRASPKTQSALLEAMEERQVSVDGVSHPLDEPFLVIATQNPIEHEGTYPLPESQLDRFLMQVSLGYPDREAEIRVLETHGEHDALADLDAVASAADLKQLIGIARRIHVAPALRGYLVDLADASRRNPHLEVGMSPRATLSLQRAARALAAANGRNYVVPDDIKSLAAPVLGHRLILGPEAILSGIGKEQVLDEVLRAVPVPSGRA